MNAHSVYAFHSIEAVRRHRSGGDPVLEELHTSAARAVKELMMENDKLRQELALHKLAQTSVELGGYGSQCALCWGKARKESVCDACRDSMEG